MIRGVIYQYIKILFLSMFLVIQSFLGYAFNHGEFAFSQDSALNTITKYYSSNQYDSTIKYIKILLDVNVKEKLEAEDKYSLYEKLFRSYAFTGELEMAANTLEKLDNETANSTDSIDNYYRRRSAYLSLILLDRRGLYRELANAAEMMIKEQFSMKFSVDVTSGDVHNITGNAYRSLGDFKKAIIHFEEAKKMYYSIDNTYGALLVDSNLASIYLIKGYYDLAEENYLNFTNQISEVHGESFPMIFWTYSNLGALYRRKGDYEKATQYFRKALNSVLNPVVKSGILYNYGLCESRLGNYDTAIALSEKSKIMLTGVPNRGKELMQNNLNISLFYAAKKDYTKSKVYLDLAQKFFSKNPDAIALNRNEYISLNLQRGFLYFSNNDIKGAERYYLKASEHVEYSTLRHEKTEHYLAIGDFYRELGRHDLALFYYQTSLIKSCLGFDDPDPRSNPGMDQILLDVPALSALKKKALILIEDDFLELETLSEVIKITTISDALGTRILRNYNALSTKLRLSASLKDIYDVGIEACYQAYGKTNDQSFVEQAFYFAERSKAIVLKENMLFVTSRDNLGIREELRSAEKILRGDIEYYKNKLSSENDKEDKLKIQDKLFEAFQSHDSVLDVTQNEYPKYYTERFYLDTLKYRDLKRNLQDLSRTLLQYHTTDSLIYGFVLDNQSITLIRLLKKANLAAMVSELQKAIVHKSPEYVKWAHQLYSEIFEPIKPYIRHTKLTIVSDGVLAYIPFDLLLSQSRSTEEVINYGKIPYLLRDYTIGYHFSGTLAISGFKEESPASRGKEFIGFAPSFVQNQSSEMIYRGVQNILQALPGAYDEVNKAADLFDGKKVLADLATETRFKSISSDYDIIHLATHAVVDDVDPMQSKFIFSAQNDSLNDGNLFTYEIYSLPIKASLVTLSACNTGTGEYRRGEGIMSLARSFAYAGCGNLIMSLWLAPDKSTSEIMNYFYKNIKRGQPKDVALRNAKLNYLSSADPMLMEPVYWGGFVFNGSPTPISMDELGIMSIYWWMMSFGLLILILLAYFLNRRPTSNPLVN